MTLLQDRFAELAPLHQLEVSLARAALAARGRLEGRDEGALRYALSLAGVDTVVLGVKNRAELEQCLAAEKSGPLEPELMAKIDGLGLKV